MADDRSIIIKKADKGSCVVIWGWNDCLMEPGKQLSDKKVYQEVSNTENFLSKLAEVSVSNTEKILSKLAEVSNKMFSNLKKGRYITEKQIKHFSDEYRKATNFGKLYFLPKIHKRFHNVPVRPVISTCARPTEKCSEFLDYHLKPLAQKGQSYIKDSGDFIKKTRNLVSIPENAILVTADVVGLYPSIPHEAGLKALREVFDKREQQTIPTNELIKRTDFVLKNNYFEFNKQTKQQISGTAIGTKFAPPYACLFMDKIETTFLQTQELQPLVWFRYIKDIFFIWTHVK